MRREVGEKYYVMQQPQEEQVYEEVIYVQQPAAELIEYVEAYDVPPYRYLSPSRMELREVTYQDPDMAFSRLRRATHESSEDDLLK